MVNYIRPLDHNLVALHFEIWIERNKTMECPKCGSDNRNGVKFCEESGAKTEIKYWLEEPGDVIKNIRKGHSDS